MFGLFGLLLSRIKRRCPVCRVPIEGAGVRRGLRLFCSPAHLEKFVQDQETWKRALGRMSNRKAGGCC